MSEIKLKYPDNGLIVSCYLEALKGTEKQFIKSVLNLNGVVALRVEGAENISFAKSVTFLPVIGLIKQQQEDGSYITANLEDLETVEQSGADFTAIDSRYCNTRLSQLYKNATRPIMADIEFFSEAVNAFRLGAKIIATTFTPKAFDLAKQVKETLQCKVNLEGGIQSPEEIQRAIAYDIDYVTVGKIINDPPTIIKYLLCKSYKSIPH